MGQWTEYDVVTGNPAIMYFYEDIYINSKKTEKQLEKEFKLKYDSPSKCLVDQNFLRVFFFPVSFYKVDRYVIESLSYPL